jgi:hypothetical protein
MRGPDLAADLALALDPVAFAEDKLRFRPDDWQRKFLRSTAKQLIFNITRQGGKSTVAAALALHTAVYMAGSLILLVSPSLRQSRELFAKIMEFLRDLEPAEELEADNLSSCVLRNRSRIVSLPGDARTVRGFSAPALIICDEAAYTEAAVFTALSPMRATNPESRLIYMSTPNGRISGNVFYETWANGGDEWERYEIPARMCPRISASFLDQERKRLGPMLFSQEFEACFIENHTSAFSTALVEMALRNDFAPFI